MTVKATTTTAKRAAVDGFKVALDDAMADLGEYRSLLLLRMLNETLTAEAKGGAKTAGFIIGPETGRPEIKRVTAKGRK